MTREELKTATNDELIYALNYCGYDSYYRDYRDDIVAEIKKRMQEPILDKIKSIVTEWKNNTWTDNFSYECMSKIAEIIDKAESEVEDGRN